VLKDGEKIVCEVQENGREILQKTEISAAQWNTSDSTKVYAPLVPGWVRISLIRVDGKGKRVRTFASQGIIVDADTLIAGTPEPTDFDAFWADQIRQFPKDMKVELKEVRMKDPGIVGYNFKLDCGNNNFAYGSIAWPKNAKEKSLPAILQVHGSSTYAIGGPSDYYAHHGIHAILSPHQIESGRESAYNNEMIRSLSGYTRRNADSREKYYMKDMILRVVRTLQYIESLPQWDGKTLVTHGESQGGFQSIAGAALDPKVSFCLAMVPALSDQMAYRAGRMNAWPHLIPDDPDQLAKTDPEKRKQIEAAIPYVDCVNFAKRIRCEVWISTGVNDGTCPPSGVISVFNALPKNNKNKHFFLSPTAGHDAGYADVVPALHSTIYPPEGPANKK